MSRLKLKVNNCLLNNKEFFKLFNSIFNKIGYNYFIIFQDYLNTVDFRYLEFDGTMEKIRVNRSSTQEELRRYRKCSLFNDERETTRAKC